MSRETGEGSPSIGTELEELHHKLGRYVQRVTGQEAAQTSKEAHLSTLRMLQDVAWGKHCQEVIAARQANWETCLMNLREAPSPDTLPINENLSQYKRAWKFEGSTEAEGQRVALHTTITTESLVWHTNIPEELLKANDYLRSSTKGRKCPETLLGVTATGRRRELPREELQRAGQAAWRTALIDNIRTINARCYASIPGAETTETLYHAQGLTTRTLDPNKRPKYKCLQPDEAEGIETAIGTPRQGEDKLTKIMDFLAQQAAEQDQFEFEQLAGVVNVLYLSHPVVPESN